MVSSRFLAPAFCALMWCAPAANATPVDLELALVIDASGSIEDDEFALQMDGYRDAFLDPAVQAAIDALPGGMAVGTYFFSSRAALRIDWTLLETAEDAAAYADIFSGLGRTPPAASGTDIAGGIALGVSGLLGNSFDGDRLIIDVSGDGPQNEGSGCPTFGDGTDPDCLARTEAARALALDAGITINALVIEPDDELFDPDGLSYFDTFITTDDGFVSAAEGFDAFAPAVRRKIFREITGEVPEPGVAVLLGAGLIALQACRRRGARGWNAHGRAV